MPRMRSRTVHPEFFTAADLYDAEAGSGLPLRLAYEGLWCAADREKRFEWKPRELKLSILPYDPVDMGKVLEALASGGFVTRYEVDGRSYGVVHNLLKWQKIHPDEAQSKLPAPPENPLPPKPKPGNPSESNGIPENPKEFLPTSTSTSTSISTSDKSVVATATPNGAVPKTGKSLRAPPAVLTWVQEAVEIYAARIGVVPHGKAGKLLKPVVDRRGWAEVKQALECFSELAPYEDYLVRMEAGTLREGEEKVKRLGYNTSLAAFVERYTYWLEQATS